jgi:hypothetical protein
MGASLETRRPHEAALTATEASETAAPTRILEEYAEQLRAELRDVERALFHAALPAPCCSQHSK